MKTVGQTNLQRGTDSPASRNTVAADERRDIRVQVAHLRMRSGGSDEDRDHDTRGEALPVRTRRNPTTRSSSTNS